MSKGAMGIALLTLFLLACGLQPVAAQETVMRLDYVVIRESPDGQGRPSRSVIARTRFVAPDGRMRTEDRDAADPNRVLSISISDENRDETILLDPNTKTAVRRRNVRQQAERGIPVFGTFAPVRGEKENLGARTIQGFECQGYRNTFPQGQQTEHWFCVDPQSGRKFLGSMRAQLADGRDWWQEDLQKITRNVPVEPGFFEVPPDFRIEDR
ncbi:MAG: hypothetical protein K6U09_03735 [Acidobacteriia bacterium]|jgi:hypothetical protein|nr:hypothetical protein [Terriglobia bacterium]